MDIALAFILFTLSFLLGYYLGEKTHGSTSGVEDLFVAINKKLKPKTRLGVVKRPTPGQVNRRLNPLQKEEEEEMTKALKELWEEE